MDTEQNTAHIDPASDELVAGIMNDARSEAERIVSAARTAAERRQDSAARQVEEILGAARKKTVAREESILEHARASGAMAARRISLHMREQIQEHIIGEARSRLRAMIGDPGYRDVLLGWIVEACIGLNEAEATVNASEAEREIIGSELLAEAAARTKALTGHSVTLDLEQGDPLLPQGIVLTAANGRVAFNNQLSTRLLRYQSGISDTVYRELFDK